jgi:hypothetical protein
MRRTPGGFGKNLQRYAILHRCKPGFAILANPLGACAEPCFSRSGKCLPDPAFFELPGVHD